MVPSGRVPLWPSQHVFVQSRHSGALSTFGGERGTGGLLTDSPLLKMASFVHRTRGFILGSKTRAFLVGDENTSWSSYGET